MLESRAAQRSKHSLSRLRCKKTKIQTKQTNCIAQWMAPCKLAACCCELISAHHHSQGVLNGQQPGYKLSVLIVHCRGAMPAQGFFRHCRALRAKEALVGPLRICWFLRARSIMECEPASVASVPICPQLQRGRADLRTGTPQSLFGNIHMVDEGTKQNKTGDHLRIPIWKQRSFVLLLSPYANVNRGSCRSNPYGITTNHGIDNNK